MYRHLGRLLIVALATSLLAACASGPSPSTAPATAGPATALPVSTAAVVATFTPVASATRLLDGRPMTPCLVQGEVPVKAEVAGFCGTLQVPEDRSRPDGRRIDLRVAVVPALAADPRAGPAVRDRRWTGRRRHAVLRLAPGPVRGVHATRDIVLVDQRGTGASNALTLPAHPDTTGLSAARGRRAPLGVDARRPRRARRGPALLHEHRRGRRPRRRPGRARVRHDRPVRHLLRRDARPVLPAPAPRPRPGGGPRRLDAARRAGPGADGGQQPARARPPARTLRRGCGVPRGVPATSRTSGQRSPGGSPRASRHVVDPETGEHAVAGPAGRAVHRSTTRC